MVHELITNFDELRQNFRIVDAIDIGVISVLLYAGIVWFKQTASRGVVIGVTVLTALYFFARAFDMYLTSLVFHTAFAVFLVVLVVVFQEEIRRVFERLAAWGTLRELRPKTTVLADEIDAVVEAAFKLTAHKTGALIVLSGREHLQRHIEGGIELSGRISQPILFSIFDPSSPGHDGALIVERDRIERFGAHLPISKNHTAIGGRGTRHAAALGLAELTDALTIVVSEERGVVSIAEHAELIETKSAADLKARVESFLDDRFPQELETTWKRYVTRDIRWKLLALLVATASWFVLAFDVERLQTSVVVPIEYRNLPQQAQIDGAMPADALVTLSGTDRAFRLLDRRELKISLDLSGVKVGTQVIPIQASNVRAPDNLSVDHIQPSEITVRTQATPPAAQ